MAGDCVAAQKRGKGDCVNRMTSDLMSIDFETEPPDKEANVMRVYTVCGGATGDHFERTPTDTMPP
ncbi:hypothetical protein E4U32_005104 [Claviceps aff. humidiphila group G2b]|nr:hypothetical protein E4U32_005104 [Claviceps aff. humidiphila group G2b]